MIIIINYKKLFIKNIYKFKKLFLIFKKNIEIFIYNKNK